MNKERLLKLADHLEHGKLGHKVFDFGVYNLRKDEGAPAKGRCGYMGCAIGECPIVWPEHWQFGPAPVLWGYRWTLESGIAWFDITADEFSHLFLPHGQYPEDYGGTELGIDATKEQVAANIRAFVAHKEKQDNG